MKRLAIRRLLAVCALFVLALATTSMRPSAVQAAGPVAHVHLFPTHQIYEQHRQILPQGPSDNLSYNGGPVIYTLAAYTIFWNPHGTISADYQNLLNRYFSDVGGSSVYNILTQYYDNPGANHIQNTSTFAGTWVDTAAYPRAGTAANPLQDSDIQAEVQRAITQNGWPTGITNMYFVFTESGIESCMDATDCTPGTLNPVYCAYHGSFTAANNDVVIYANMPYGNTPTWGGGCAQFSVSPNNNMDADVEISITSHEHFEAVSDPEVNVNGKLAWYDDKCAGGVACGEIGDKCAYMYGSIGADGSNIALGGHPYIMQQEWSNAANNGAANSGCQISYNAPPPPPPGSVSVTQAWTANGKKNLATTFKPGAAIRYYATLNNSGTATCATTTTFMATGPATILNWSGTINVPVGTSNWYIARPKIPRKAPLGTYTLTVSTVDCNGNSSSNRATFTLTKTGKEPVTGGANMNLQEPSFGSGGQ